MNINIEKCSDIRCFSDSHKTCPKCFGIFHMAYPYEIILSKCKTTACFDDYHIYCPDCYCVIHVVITKI